MKEDILPIDTPTEAQWQQVSSTKRRPQYPPADSPTTEDYDKRVIYVSLVLQLASLASRPQFAKEYTAMLAEDPL
jgi:hypothetical protein